GDFQIPKEETPHVRRGANHKSPTTHGGRYAGRSRGQAARVQGMRRNHYAQRFMLPLRQLWLEQRMLITGSHGGSRCATNRHFKEQGVMEVLDTFGPPWGM